MKRILLYLLIIVGGSYGAIYWLITSKVKNQLDQAVQLTEGLGDLTYGQIWVLPQGEVRIHNLNFAATNPGSDVSIERVSLETDNLMALYQLGQSLSNDEVPQRLQLTFDGIALDLGLMQNLIETSGNNGSQQQFMAAGCGDERTFFNFTDLDDMGYRQVRSDMVLEYQLSPARDSLRVEGAFTTETMYRMSWLLDMGLAGDSGAVAMMGATFNQVRIRVDDLGYVPQVMAYCARQTGLSTEAYRTRHLNAWERLWQQQGVTLGNDVVAAYAAYVEQPDSISLESYAGLNAMQIMMIGDPQALLDQLAPQIVVNGTEPVPLQLTLALPEGRPEVEPEVAPSETQPETVPEPAPRKKASRLTSVPVAQLGNWLNTDMIITLADGREFRGEVSSIDGQQIQFKQSLSGGTIVMPFERTSIRQVRVVNQ
jgi:hypothetical protein